MQIWGSKTQPIEWIKENPEYLDQYWQAHLDAVASIEKKKQQVVSTDTNVWNKQDQNKFMSRSEFDSIHWKMVTDWYSDKEIIDWVLDKGYELEWWRETQEDLHIETQQEEKKWFMSLSDMAKNTWERSKKLWTELLDIGKERLGEVKDIINWDTPEMKQLKQDLDNSKKTWMWKFFDIVKSWAYAGLLATWEVWWLVSDSIFAGIKSFIPDEKKEQIKEWLKNIWETKLWQAWLNALSEWIESLEEFKNKSDKNARIVKWIEAVINIADFVPILEWASIVWKWIKKVWGAGAKVLWEWAELVWEWVKSIVKQTDFDGAIKQVGKDLSKTINKYKPDVNIKKHLFLWKKNRQSNWYLMNQITWLEKDTRDFAIKHPELLTKAQKGDISVETTINDLVKTIDNKKDEISNFWWAYKTLRDIDTPIDTKELKPLSKQVLEKNDIKVSSDGTLSFAGTVFDDTEERVITKARDTIRNKSNMKPKEILNIRRKLDKLIDYRSEVTSDAERVVKWLRQELNTIAHNKVNWLKELDSKIWPLFEDMSKLKKDWLNRDWSLKDSAHSKIFNLLNKSNIQRLARLEKEIPWITNKIRSLKAVDDITKASSQKVGNYARSFAIGGWLFTANPVLLAAWISTQPKVVIWLLKKIWKFKNRKKIISKIASDISLNDSELLEITHKIESKYPQLYRMGKQRMEKIIWNTKTKDLWKEITNKALPNKTIDWFINDISKKQLTKSKIDLSWLWERRLSYINDWLDLVWLKDIDVLPDNLQKDLIEISRRWAMGKMENTIEMTDNRLNNVEKWKKDL